MSRNKGWRAQTNIPSLIYRQFVRHIFELDSKGREKLGNERNKVFDYSKFNDRIDTQSDFVASK